MTTTNPAKALGETALKAIEADIVSCLLASDRNPIIVATHLNTRAVFTDWAFAARLAKALSWADRLRFLDATAIEAIASDQVDYNALIAQAQAENDKRVDAMEG